MREMTDKGISVGDRHGRTWVNGKPNDLDVAPVADQQQPGILNRFHAYPRPECLYRRRNGPDSRPPQA
jgi:hypothetical protein